MWKTLRVRNFKCLRDVTLHLEPFTVLIGKNDTGKSSALQAMHTLSQVVRGNGEHFRSPWAIADVLSHDATDGAVHWEATVAATARNRLPASVTYSVAARDSGVTTEIFDEALTFEEPSVRTRITPAPASDGRTRIVSGGARGPESSRTTTADRAGPSSVLSQYRNEFQHPELGAVASALTSAVKYRLDPRVLAQDVELPADVRRGPARMSFDGGGLALVLGELADARDERLEEIETELRRAIPSLVRILTPIQYDSPPKRALRFRLVGGGEAPAALVSEGALLYLAYLALSRVGGLPSVLLVEEPENGIHPHRLKSVVGMLQALTAEARGLHRVQIVVTTHSPYVLDFVDPESVLVFGRSPEGGTIARKVTASPLFERRRKSGFSLGELWFNEGEDALLRSEDCAS